MGRTSGSTVKVATKTVDVAENIQLQAEQIATEPIAAKPSVVEEDLNLDAKVTVRNLAPWGVTFARMHEGVGDVQIAKGGKQRLSRNEVQAQVNSGNKLFVGIDGVGSHSTLYIDDAPTRRLVGFEDDNEKQLVFTDEIARKLFDMEYSDFEKNLPTYITTRAEKYAFIEAIRRLGFNDYKKMVHASEYTGYKI